MRLHPRVEQISTSFDNVRIELYLVRGERNILIDAGTPEMPERDILPALKALGLTLSDVSLILNTHGHSDHTGGDAAVKAASNAQVFIHEDDAPFLQNPENCFDRYFSPVVQAIGSSLQAEKQAFLGEFGAPIVPDRKLEDGDVIDAGKGVKLHAVHLPGHTLGSVALYWEEEGILFTGDSLLGLYLPNGKVPIIFDLPAYMKSVQKVLDMPVRVLFCSHYYRGLHLAPAPVRQGEEVTQYLQDCMEFSVRFDEAVRKVGSSAHEKGFMQLADEIIAQLPDGMGFKPMTQLARPLYFSGRTVFSHLDRLYRYGATGT